MNIFIEPEYINQACELWPELEWIKNNDLKEKTTRTWALALQKSVLTPSDLNTIPFTLLCGPDLKVTFMDHKRAVVHNAPDAMQSSTNSPPTSRVAAPTAWR